MKKRLIKPLSLLFVILTVLSSFMLTVYAADTKTVTSGNFVFSVKDKTATLTEYKGDAKTVKVPSKVKGATVRAVGDYAFWQKKNMKSVTLPKTVKSIGVAAFNECSALKEVKMPYYLTEIKDAAFWYCTGLETVRMNKKAASFGENVFKGCKKLTVYVYEDTKAEKFAKEQSDIETGYYYAGKLKASKSVSCALSKTAKLKITTVPENVYGIAYTYKSSDEKIVSVSSKGVVKGLKVGSATVTATTKNTKNGKAKSVKIKVNVKPQAVTALKATDKTPTSYKLTWNKAASATGYIVYTKNASGKWVKLQETVNNFLEIKNVKLGSSASYRVKTVLKEGKNTYYSANSKALLASALVPANVSGLKCLSSTTDSITLTWNKVPYATGYRVYSYDATAKAYKYIAYTTTEKAAIKNLKENTSYAYAVKAYFLSGKDVVFSKAYSPLLSCCTVPRVVSGLKEMENTAAVDSITLTWDAVKDITGYELSYLGEGAAQWKTVSVASNLNAYKLIKEDGINEYKFKIRAVRKTPAATYYGAYSEEITVVSSAVPEDNNQALEAFSTALSNAEAYTPPFNLFVSKAVTGLYEETLDPRVQNIISDLEGGSYAQYDFKDGKDTKTALTLKEIMAPQRGEAVFTKELVDTESLSYQVNGSGYSMSFNVKDEKGTMFTPEIDFAALAEKHGFTLGNVTYETFIDQTKIQSDRFDMMRANVTFSADIIFGEETFNLKGTVSYQYLFSWAQ